MQDITHIDYRIQGYKKDKTTNTFGDVSEVLYYENYEEGVFYNLMVKETRSQDRNNPYGIPTETTVEIGWYTSDKATPRATKVIKKPLNTDDGLKVNQMSRNRLLNFAKSVAIGMLGMDPGKAFMATAVTEMALYVDGERAALITAINASATPQNFKDAMVGILDISYVPEPKK